MLTGRTDPETEAPILWPSHEKTPWKRPWWWESVKAIGEGDDRGWDGWTVLSKQPTWIWHNSGRQWKTGGPGVLWSLGSRRVRHDWTTKQQKEQQSIMLSRQKLNVDLAADLWVIYRRSAWFSDLLHVTGTKLYYWNLKSLGLLGVNCFCTVTSVPF